jgi:hypothetical protein
MKGALQLGLALRPNDPAFESSMTQNYIFCTKGILSYNNSNNNNNIKNNEII